MILDPRATPDQKGDPGTPALGTFAYGTASVATGLIGGGTRDITVTLNRAMPSATYGVVVQVNPPPQLLGQMAGVVKSQTATTVVVTVKNSALVNLGSAATVAVIAAA